MLQRLLPLAAALLLVIPAGAGAATTSAGGRADFSIASKTAKVLKRGKVKMTATGGSASATKAVLPVTSGSSNGALLGGGIKFKKGKKVLKLSALTLDRSQGLLYAKVGKVVVPFFLAEAAKATEQQDGTDTILGPFRIKLSAIGASVFASRMGGTKIGTGSSFATLRVALQGASTRLTLDPAFSTALSGGGLKVSPAGDAIEGSAGLHVPVSTSKGKVSLTAPITHSGGFTLVSATTLLTLNNLTIEPVAGIVSAEGPSGALPLLSINKTAAKTARRGGQLVVTGLGLALTAEAAAAINATFGVTSFVAGAPVGTAVIVGVR